MEAGGGGGFTPDQSDRIVRNRRRGASALLTPLFLCRYIPGLDPVSGRCNSPGGQTGKFFVVVVGFSFSLLGCQRLVMKLPNHFSN